MTGMVTVHAVAPADWYPVLGPMLLASLPAFVFGVAEDLSKRVGPRLRLLATMGSGVLASLMTNTALDHTGLPWFDAALQAWWPLAVAFTAFAVGGVANAVNIVDGFNGLAGGLVIICLCALGVIAVQAGDHTLACASPPPPWWWDSWRSISHSARSSWATAVRMSWGSGWLGWPFC